MGTSTQVSCLRSTQKFFYEFKIPVISFAILTYHVIAFHLCPLWRAIPPAPRQTGHRPYLFPNIELFHHHRVTTSTTSLGIHHNHISSRPLTCRRGLQQQTSRFEHSSVITPQHPTQTSITLQKLAVLTCQPSSSIYHTTTPPLRDGWQ